MPDCPAMVTVYIKPEIMYTLAGQPVSIESEEMEIQCFLHKDHEDDHKTWIPSYGYVRFPKNNPLG